MKSYLHISLVLLLSRTALGATWTKSGCFKQSDSLGFSLSDKFIYQSSGHCEGQCSDKRVAALLNGAYCYCGDTAPDPDNEIDESNCNVACVGYGFEECGGSSAFLVYVNGDVDDAETTSSTTSTSSTKTSTSSTSTSTTSTSSTSSTSTTSSTSEASTSNSNTPTSTVDSSTEESSNTPTSTSSGPSTSSSSSSKTHNQVTTIVSTLTTNPSGTQQSVIYKTIVDSSAPSPTSSDSADGSKGSDNDKGSNSKSLSTGGIVGAVIGSILGLALLAGLIFGAFWYRKRRNEDDDYDDEFTLSGPDVEKSQGIRPPSLNPNPFLVAGGYNFDTAQQGQNNGGSPDSTHVAHSRQASQLGVGTFGHGYNNSNGGNSGGEHSFNSQPDNDFTFLDPPSESPPPEFNGRRRLSNGSLPDIIARQPGSLKVVNN
ncbi:uncharacterized protein RJT20DRAFT_29593 [Scheffersomyces xylosifermentans]|uniref:uncharacterized protein n=1 Tax=Scheffersomyces xylosifermentans TaxID=1304137 RepID=UPI00315DB613